MGRQGGRWSDGLVLMCRWWRGEGTLGESLMGRGMTANWVEETVREMLGGR
jgi:hypothetical protein